MTKEQVKAIAEFRQFMSKQGCNTDHMTDEQLADAVRKTLGNLSEAFTLLRIMARRYLNAKNPRLTKLDEDQRRQRQLMYRKKISQTKRKA